MNKGIKVVAKAVAIGILLSIIYWITQLEKRFSFEQMPPYVAKEMHHE